MSVCQFLFELGERDGVHDRLHPITTVELFTFLMSLRVIRQLHCMNLRRTEPAFHSTHQLHHLLVGGHCGTVLWIFFDGAMVGAVGDCATAAHPAYKCIRVTGGELHV